MAYRFHLSPAAHATALCIALPLASAAWAQTSSTPGATVVAQATLPRVTVNASPTAQADVAGFDAPLRELPLSATVIGSDAIEQRGARRLADLTALDSSVTDAYNAGGYWDYLTVRGFVLDNRFNYRREGLPINAETFIALDNKERVEILKGTSGIQAGTSAPGGLVNFVVKRPTARELRDVRLEWTQSGSVLAAADLSGRAGADGAFGWRLNAAHETLRPTTRALNGERRLLSLATEWKLGRDQLLEAEIETSQRSQPTQAGFSLLGNTLPAPVDPRINLNNQPWSQPTVLGGLTGTLRYELALNTQWRMVAQAGTQRLKSDDRIAFPFGCSAENNYDRYCSDGTYDLYDFRSDGERRRQSAAQVVFKGRIEAAGIRHDLSFGLLRSTVTQRFNLQAYNYVGTGNVAGTLITPADPTLGDQNTNRDERSNELRLQDAVRLGAHTTAWLGLRHTQLSRESIRTNGTRPTGYDQRMTTPWFALSHRLAAGPVVYASYGEGIESQVVPNRASQYSNAGAALPALRSRQRELGIKSGALAVSGSALAWQLALFDITRPVSNLDACSRLGITPCEGRFDGEAVHRGLEATLQQRLALASGPLQWSVAGTFIDARRRASVEEPALNGIRPANVPRNVLRAQASWQPKALPGLAAQVQWQREGERNVLPDGSITLAAWSRIDAALHYETTLRGSTARWTLGVDNLLDRRYWRESPYQFGHVYLYPGAVRTARLGLQLSL